jgi:hypothetical protein
MPSCCPCARTACRDHQNDGHAERTTLPWRLEDKLVVLTRNGHGAIELSQQAVKSCVGFVVIHERGSADAHGWHRGCRGYCHAKT